jgi:hypothetical protein
MTDMFHSPGRDVAQGDEQGRPQLASSTEDYEEGDPGIDYYSQGEPHHHEHPAVLIPGGLKLVGHPVLQVLVPLVPHGIRVPLEVVRPVVILRAVRKRLLGFHIVVGCPKIQDTGQDHQSQDEKGRLQRSVLLDHPDDVDLLARPLLLHDVG